MRIVMYEQKEHMSGKVNIASLPACGIVLLAWVICSAQVASAQTLAEILDSYSDVRVLVLANPMPIYERTDTGSAIEHTAGEGDTLYVFRPSGSFTRAASKSRGYIGFILQSDIRFLDLQIERNPRYKVIDIETAPVKIINYSAEYQRDQPHQDEGIRHTKKISVPHPTYGAVQQSILTIGL